MELADGLGVAVGLVELRDAALAVFWLAGLGLGLRATYNAADDMDDGHRALIQAFDRLRLGWVAAAAAASYALALLSLSMPV